jgi:response regulator RpfG family c-di-GMP phosphodiesterase
MVSGMVIIPLLTVFLKEQSPMLRAGVAAAAVIPTAAFAVINGRKTRTKLIAAAADKHRDKLKRELETLLKQRVDRFRADAERHAHAWLADRQRDLLAALEPLVATVFDERERGLASQLARTQLDSERIADQLGQLRQIKTNLTSQVLVDLRRLGG